MRARQAECTRERRDSGCCSTSHSWGKGRELYLAVARPAHSRASGPEKRFLAPAVATVVAALEVVDDDDDAAAAAAAAVKVVEAVAAAAAAAAEEEEELAIASTAAVAWPRAHSAGDGMAAAVGHAYGAWQRLVKLVGDWP